MDARSEVEDAYRRQLDAMVAGDVNALDEFLADDYAARHITGHEQPKAEWLNQMRDGLFIYHHVDVQSLDTSVEEGVATLASRAFVTVTIGGSKGRWPLQSTMRFQRRSGCWIATESSSTTY